jgi:hypothetical protein
MVTWYRVILQLGLWHNGIIDLSDRNDIHIMLSCVSVSAVTEAVTLTVSQNCRYFVQEVVSAIYTHTSTTHKLRCAAAHRSYVSGMP